MKKYILVVNNISGVGGAQLYILRKAKFLEKKGYRIFIISGNANNIKFKEFYNYKFLEIPEMNFSPNRLSRNQRKKVMDTFLNFIDYKGSDTIFIESHQIYPSFWGEIFSERIKCTNLVYCIAPMIIKNKLLNGFFNKKLIFNELLGCNESYIADTFGYGYNNNFFNIPFDKNEIKVEHINDKTKGYDLKILTISRVEKTYIKQSILDLIEFCKKNPSKKIKYDLVVSKNEGKDFIKLTKIITNANLENLDLNISGPLLKLTTSIFENHDIFLGMGTSVLNAVSMNVPALVVDYRNNKYYGFFGVDHYEFGSAKKKADKNLDYFLYRLLNKEIDIEEIKDKAYSYFLENYENDKVNNDFLNYQININKIKNKSYFSFDRKSYDVKAIIDTFLIHLFGVEKAITIKSNIGKIKNIVKKDKNYFR